MLQVGTCSTSTYVVVVFVYYLQCRTKRRDHIRRLEFLLGIWVVLPRFRCKSNDAPYLNTNYIVASNSSVSSPKQVK